MGDLLQEFGDTLAVYQALLGIHPLWMILTTVLSALLLFAVLLFWDRFKSVFYRLLTLTVSALLALMSALLFFAGYSQWQLWQEQSALATASANGVSSNIQLLLSSRQQELRNFIDRYRSLLIDLYDFPADEEVITELGELVHSQLKGAYAFMLVDEFGRALLSDALIANHFGGLGQQCLADLKAIAAQPLSPVDHPAVHGFSEQTYHIDVIDPIKPGSFLSPYLFVSFRVNDLILQLKNAEVPGQSLLLLSKFKPGAIELSSDGVFHHREFQNQVPAERMHSALFQDDIPGSSWKVAVFADKALLHQNAQELLARSAGLFVAVLFLTGVLIWRLYHEQLARARFEQELIKRGDYFEDSVLKGRALLQQKETELEQIFSASPYGLLQVDQAGRMERVNQQWLSIFGYQREELLGQMVEMLIPERFHANHTELRSEFTATESARLMGKGRHLKGLCKDGQEVFLDLGLGSYAFGDQKKTVVAAIDVGFIVESIQQLEKERERALVTLNAIGDGVITTDAEGRIHSINPIAQRLSGFSPQDALGQPIETVFAVVNEDSREPVENPVRLCLQRQMVVQLAKNSVLLHRSGRDIPIEDTAAPIRTHNGELVGVVLVFHDVSQSRRYAREMEYQASHDSLTGLFNRAYFMNRVEAILERQQITPSQSVLLFLDLDRFKIVNDDAGHQAGDRLLSDLGGLIASQLRERDAFARLGGDEFGVLLEHCPQDKGFEIARKILAVVEKYRLYEADKVYSVGVSIGLLGFQDPQLRDADTLLHQVDFACRQAKEGGRNRIAIYEAESDVNDPSPALVNQLNRALDEDRMQLFQQLILPTSGDFEGAHIEILLRIEEGDTLISPVKYLAIAERFGLSARVDTWVLEHLCQWVAGHADECLKLQGCSVNLSAQSLTDSSFLQVLENSLTELQPLRDKLILEITETAAISNLEKARSFIKRFRQMGCRFSLDDFGSGYSSYAYLKNLQVDFLKIDGAFVRDMAVDPVDRVIVASVNDVAHAVGLKTVAEYVESEAIAEDLRLLGVDYLQGYAVSKPAPLDELLR